MSLIRAFQISGGLGAGNIGDELMAHAFWSRLPADLTLDVALFPESARQRAPYPARHRYVPVDWRGNENSTTMMPGLLVGGTPVTDAEGIEWPMRFLAPRLQHFHSHGLPVDAVGIGVENLATPEAGEIFRQAFAPIRSWTVRSEACRAILLRHGIEAARVRVGADWGWLYQPQQNLAGWAQAYWRSHGVDPSRPLLVANLVNMIWRNRLETRRAIATALDQAISGLGLQVAFFCNECRDGDFFDSVAAKETMQLMVHRPALIPNEYFAPDEALALLRYATITVAQRFHFVIETVAAGSVPIVISRGQKMTDLAAELGIECPGTIDQLDGGRLFSAIADALQTREGKRDMLAAARALMIRRAECNLSFLRELVPYQACRDWNGSSIVGGNAELRTPL